MKKTNYLDLITSIDVLNTINGGVSEPQMNLVHYEDSREIRIKVPGIDLSDIKVEVHNNNLAIFYFIQIACVDRMIPFPKFVYNRNVPYYVDISRISARIEEEEIVVLLPFNQLANGFHREIRIKES